MFDDASLGDRGVWCCSQSAGGFDAVEPKSKAVKILVNVYLQAYWNAKKDVACVLLAGELVFAWAYGEGVVVQTNPTAPGCGLNQQRVIKSEQK